MSRSLSHLLRYQMLKAQQQQIQQLSHTVAVNNANCRKHVDGVSNSWVDLQNTFISVQHRSLEWVDYGTGEIQVSPAVA